jgi:two-component system sensor histidine kinase PilS (NtrC family)
MADASDQPARRGDRQEVLHRRLLYIMLVRVLVFTVLLGGTVVVNMAWGTPEALGTPYNTTLFVFIATIYVINIAYGLLFRLIKHLERMAIFQLAVDLLTSATMVHFTGGGDSPFVLFFLLATIGAAVTLSRRAAIFLALAGTSLLALVTLLGYLEWIPPLPGQLQLPRQATIEGLSRTILLHGGAMFAVATLAGYLAAQLQSTTMRVEVQQAHIDDLAALNADIIRCLTSGLVTVSADGRVLSINEAAIEILGPKAEGARGRTLAEISQPLASATTDPGRIRRAELTIEREGDRRVLGISVSPLTNRDNDQLGRIINFQDLSQFRKMERAIKQSQHLASLGRIAAGIAHEIRNPLASISGSIELLGKTGSKEQDERLIKIAVREIDRLNKLITDFLQYARPKEPALHPLDLGLEMETLVAAVSELLSGSNTPRVVLDAPEEALWVRADRDQLSGVIWNLVRNAWQAGEKDTIRITLHRREPYVVMEVADRGSGIDPRDLDQIFEPFFTTKDKGTGLGLATVQRVVSQHDGQITVRSHPGHGTTFTIRLPAIPIPDEPYGTGPQRLQP